MFDWYKIYYVKTLDIKYGAKTPFCYNQFNQVLDSDWDLSYNEIENFIVYKDTIKFIENNEISDSFYSFYKKDIRQYYIEKFIKTFEDIKNNGFRIQKELKNNNIEIFDPDNKCGDEICIAITREGKFLLINGWHRFVIAKYLNIDTIPVRICFRHKLWVDDYINFKEFCKKEWEVDKRGEVYQPIECIDYNTIIPIWTEYRYNIISSNLNSKSGKILDIGSLFGYFCHKFEDDGYECLAVENYNRFLPYLRKFKKITNKKFEIFDKSIFDLKENEFDIVLAFNIFHHFLKNESDYNKLIIFLKNLKIKEMFIQIHNFNEKQMENAYVNYSPIEFIEFINKQVGFSNYKEIGEELNRKIFKLW
jgi:hypothetical protein